MNLISQSELSSYPSIRYEPGCDFSALVDSLDLDRSGIYIVWGVSGNIPSWLVGTQDVVYVGKSIKLSKRVKSSSHHVVSSLRYLKASFSLSFIFVEEASLIEEESSTISRFKPWFNVHYNQPELISPHTVYGLLPYISKSKGDLDLAVEIYSDDHPVNNVVVTFKRLVVQENRKTTLKYRDMGLHFLGIKRTLANASKLHPISSDMGEFTSFDHFLRVHQSYESGLKRAQIYKYIRLAENWDVIEDLKLMDDNAAYRLEVTIDIIRWGLEKRSQGYDLTELDHHLYFDEKRGKGEPDPKVPSKKELQIEVSSLRAMLQDVTEKNQHLMLENDRLKAELCLKHS